MAFHFQKAYGREIERPLRQYSRSPSANDRQCYAAVEAIKLGHGWTRYIAHVLGCGPQTVKNGMRQLERLLGNPAGDRIRKSGGGRKKTEDTGPGLIRHVSYTINDRTAGDAVRSDVLWTDLPPQDIANELRIPGVSAGLRTVRRILDPFGFACRQIAKVLPEGYLVHRDVRSQHLAHLIQEFLAAGSLVLSIDTKKKECSGTLCRDGKIYGHDARKAFSHDFPSLASVVTIPHGIYDLPLNHDWIHLGLSWDTVTFACDSRRMFWQHDDQRLYPYASAILKVQPDRTPLFCYVIRACQGMLFDSLQTVMQLIQKTKTQQGLSVIDWALDKLYEAGRKVSDTFKKNMPIVLGPVLPKWN